jgi:hypothetical protein
LDSKKSEPTSSSNLLSSIMKTENLNNISPNSDVSNSSLNLNYSSLIINPMKLTFENSLPQTNETNMMNMIETAKLFVDQTIQKQEDQQFKVFTSSSLTLGTKVKTKEAKVLKKQQKINSSIEKKKKFPINKPTVAALLSAVYENNPTKITTPEKTQVTDDQPLPPSIPVAQVSNDVPIVENLQPMPASLIVGKSKKQSELKLNGLDMSLAKKNSNPKPNNKLKDYFKSNNDNFFSNKSNNICNLKSSDSSSLLNIQSTELPELNKINSQAEISQQNNSQYHMLDEELLFKKKSLKLNKKLNRELMMQEKKLKKKNKLLEALAAKNLKQKKKKSLIKEEETNQLVFEIVGDDGFYVQSNDINSKFFNFIFLAPFIWLKFKNYHSFFRSLASRF